jgi:hypothetical protein
MPLFEPSALVQFFLLAVLFLVGPKLYFYKIVSDMEAHARILERYVGEATALVVETCREKGNPREDPKRAVEEAFDFFLIPPVDLDPFGILKKVEYLIDRSEETFERTAEAIAPESDEIWRANIVSLLKGGVGLHSIAKTVRHFVELVKKTKNIMLAAGILMNLPLIKRIAEAQKKGVEAIAKGRPIGDGIGPLVAAHLIEGGGGPPTLVAKDVLCQEVERDGRKLLVLKAEGPGAKLGKIGEGVKKVCGEHSIQRIVTIDASLKMEGEKTGKVSKGIGAAIGDPGPEKSKIEETALAAGIPLEAYVIKMSLEEAISPLTKTLGEAVPAVLEAVQESLQRTPEGRTLLIVGVGNTCGIGNRREEVEGLELPEEEKVEEKEGWMDRLIKRMFQKPEERRAR